MISPQSLSPIITGTGIFTLDAVPISYSSLYHLFAGGSTINVLTILATKGWKAYPVGQIGTDRASNYFLKDLKPFGLSLDYVLQSSSISMPVYVQHPTAESHRFVRECPSCGWQFSHYTPIDELNAERIVSSLPNSIQIIYLERIAPGALHFARLCKNKGALLFFEPNRIDDEALFLECLRQADIFKYSNERFQSMAILSDRIPIPLEIETAGKEGLRYRTAKDREWNSLPAQSVKNFIDAAGSGDWLSATLIQHIHQRGWSCLLQEQKYIQEALNHGQARSASNCSYTGARGKLYTNFTPLTGNDFCEKCNLH